MSACSLQIILSLLSSASLNGGKLELAILLHDEHSSHASTPERLRQFSALASSSAKSFFPMPSSPVKSREPGRRPPASNFRRVSLTSSLPISFENIKGKAQRAKSYSLPFAL